MSVRSGQSITSVFTTRRFDTGAATNGDSLPTGTLYVNGTADAASVTVTNITTGVYKAAVTLPTLAVGDVVSIRISATVNSVTDNGKVWEDIKDLVIDSAGLTDANAVKIGPTGSGTAQTARDIGASVLLSSGAGAGQLDFTSGVVKANSTQILGGAIPSPTVTGIPNVNTKTINDVATTSVTTINANIGTTQPVNYSGTGATAYVKCDAEQLNAQAITASAGVTFPASVASPTNITAGTITTVTTVTNQLTVAQIATGIWQDATAGDFTTASSIGKALYVSNVAPGGSGGLAVVGSAMTLAANQHVIVDSGTVTTVTNQLTAAQIATGVWQDTTAADFTVSSSIGKSLYTTGNAPGAASGIAIVGSNMGTTSNALLLAGAATVVLTDASLTAAKIAPDAITAGKIADGAIDTATFAAGTTIPRVTLADTLMTYTGNTPQTGDSYPVVSSVTSGNAALKTLLDTIASYVDTEVAAIKVKTDNLPSDPADASDIAASFTSIASTLSTIASYIDTEVAAIKAQTDKLLFDGSNFVKSDPQTSVTVSDKTGFKLASDGLDSIAVTAPTTVATTFPGMLVQMWRRFFAKSTLTATQLKTYADDGTTVVSTQTVSDTGSVQTQGSAT